MKTIKKQKISKGLEIEKIGVTIKKEKEEFWLDPLLYNVGIYLITPILLGVFIGLSLDKWLGTKPFFLILFIILGTISSFYNFWKIAKE